MDGSSVLDIVLSANVDFVVCTSQLFSSFSFIPSSLQNQICRKEYNFWEGINSNLFFFFFCPQGKFQVQFCLETNVVILIQVCTMWLKSRIYKSGLLLSSIWLQSRALISSFKLSAKQNNTKLQQILILYRFQLCKLVS